MKSVRIARSLLLTGTGIIALSSGAWAEPIYSLVDTIAVPATPQNNQGGAFTGFDISFADTTGYVYIADRSNAAVDVINGATNQIVAQAGGAGVFTGQQSSNAVSGPDGVLVAHVGGQSILYAGNGTSDVVAFNAANPAAPTLLPFSPTSTGGSFRADEMAFSPATGQLMVANNADSPAYATLINAATGAVQVGHITIPGSSASGGLEQSVWDPHTGTFFVSVPAFAGANDPGGIAEINTSGNVIATFHFASFGISSCSPAGLAVGGNGHLMVGCANANTQTVVFDPTAHGGTGAVVAKLTQVSGTDELWSDATTDSLFVTGVNTSGDHIIGVFDETTLSLEDEIDLTALGTDDVAAHSVTVDPLNGHVFVPLEGSPSNTLCASGCVAVFAVPEPSSLALFAFGLLGIAGASVFLKRSTT
jgi:hypothetical protein